MIEIDRRYFKLVSTFFDKLLRNLKSPVKMMEDASEPSDNEGPVGNGVAYTQVSAAEKRSIFVAVRSTMVEGVKQRGIFAKIGRELNFDRGTVARQWRIMEASLQLLLNNHPGENEQDIIETHHHILFKTKHDQRRLGRFKHHRELLKLQIRAMALKSRRTRRQVAGHLNLPLTTVHWLIRQRPIVRGPRELYGGTILKVHSSSLKPTLNNGNKLHRFLYAMDQVKPGTLAVEASQVPGPNGQGSC